MPLRPPCSCGTPYLAMQRTTVASKIHQCIGMANPSQSTATTASRAHCHRRCAQPPGGRALVGPSVYTPASVAAVGGSTASARPSSAAAAADAEACATQTASSQPLVPKHDARSSVPHAASYPSAWSSRPRTLPKLPTPLPELNAATGASRAPRAAAADGCHEPSDATHSSLQPAALHECGY